MSVRRLAPALAAVLALSACGTAEAISGPPVHEAEPHDPIEVQGAELVTNDDGSATLTATVLNHTDRTVELYDVMLGGSDDAPAADRLVVYGHGVTGGSTIEVGAHGTATFSGAGDPFRLRLEDAPVAGAVVPVMFGFSRRDEQVVVDVPVVERSAAHADVTGNVPLDDVTVEDARIVVVPGQSRAYVSSSLRGETGDAAYELPTATTKDGDPIDLRYRTATGGPYGVFVQPDEPTVFGRSETFLQPESDVGGDSEYVLAEDVEIGQTILITFAFQRGTFTAPFTVVQGNADGTIAE